MHYNAGFATSLSSSPTSPPPAQQSQRISEQAHEQTKDELAEVRRELAEAVSTILSRDAEIEHLKKLAEEALREKVRQQMFPFFIIHCMSSFPNPISF